MANFIDYDFLTYDGTRSLSDVGYFIVPIYSESEWSWCVKKRSWILENLLGSWTAFHFGSPSSGRSYCFELEEDAMAFKLRWL